MTTQMAETIAVFISKNILKQPDRVLGTEEKLISSGLIDSFSLVDLAMFIEDSFGVRIEDTELNADTFDTLTQLVQHIHKKQQ